jgi:hypothetical protein
MCGSPRFAVVPSWIWIGWLVVTGLSFAVLETIALIDRRRGDTLSENIRAWLGIDPVRPQRRIAIPVFIGAFLTFVAWFVPHIVLR